MSLKVKFLEKKKFEITCRSHEIIVDQKETENGTDQGMDPVELFNASLASCAAFYVLSFISRRVKSSIGLQVESNWEYSEDPHWIGKIFLRIILPSDFPKKDIDSLLRVVEHCTIKNTLENPPKIQIQIG